MSDRDPELEEQVARLHELLVYRRWWIALGCWLTLGTYGLWGLRQEFSLWRDHFTWTAVRYAFIYNRLPGLCLCFCIGLTVAILVWQSRNILFGLSKGEKLQLARQVIKIRAAGPKHRLWRQVCRK